MSTFQKIIAALHVPRTGRASFLQNAASRGFTLIELLVVISISMLLLLSVLFLDIGPKGKPSVDTAAQQLSVIVRQALAYGLAIVGTNNNFDVGYGVRVNTNAATQAILYVDVNKNNLFDAGDTTMQTLTFPSDVTVQKFCVDKGSTPTCYNAGASSNALDISFARSSFIGVISVTPNGGSADKTWATTTIYLQSASDPAIIEQVKVNRAGLVDIIGI